MHHPVFSKRRWSTFFMVFMVALAVIQLTGNGCWHPALRPVHDPQAYVCQILLSESKMGRNWGGYPTFQDSFKWGASKILATYPDIKLKEPGTTGGPGLIQVELLRIWSDYVQVRIQYNDPAWPGISPLEKTLDVRLDCWGVVQGWVRPGTHEVLQLAVRINRPGA